MELALSVSKEELKEMIKVAVREAIDESSWERFLKPLGYVSDREMEEIENSYDKPDENVFYTEELVI